MRNKQPPLEGKRLTFPTLGYNNKVPMKWIVEVREQAKQRGWTGYNDTYWEGLFSDYFFYNKDRFPFAYRELSFYYIMKGLHSFHSVASNHLIKHEHKTMVCGMILESLCAKEKTIKQSFLSKLLKKPLD